MRLNEHQLQATTWMNLTNTMVCERRPMENRPYCLVQLYELQNQARLTPVLAVVNSARLRGRETRGLSGISATVIHFPI